MPYFFLEDLPVEVFALVVLLAVFLWTIVFLPVVLFLFTVTFFLEPTLPCFTLLLAVVFALVTCVVVCVAAVCVFFDVPANAMDGAARNAIVAIVVKKALFTEIPPLILELANHWP
ncbi:hypothetical protein C7445_11061 [Alicyclobacillus sacchari]|uniref:Transmembrane protein n=1 Tax=Alicyclobacillus sacchari TaxID=392010 RepID=A0A4R8LJU8_9BACL|nr:hypothetical protein C7445_11061 [Alicyclobacillus sacchari]